MSLDILERIIAFELSYFLALDDVAIEKFLCEVSSKPKERVNKIGDLEIVIYSNDHNPPHFHVKSNDLKINAKFSMDNCNLISGSVNSQQLKRIKAFYLSPNVCFPNQKRKKNVL
jgi:hypothetical protein